VFTHTGQIPDFGGTIVEKIIMDHLGDLENRKFDKIAKRLSVPI